MKNLHRFGILTATALLTIVPVTALAAEVQTGKTVSIPTTQLVAENEYLAGGQVMFSSTAQKDLIAVGGQVTVNGPVWGDAMVAGGSVQILQPVKGDVRAAGGQVTIGGNVSGDVVVGGGSVTILSGTVVGGDVIAAGGTVDIEGTVNGKVSAYGGDVTINGMVAGPVTIKAGKSVTFGAQAVMGSTLDYSAPKEATIAPGAKLGDKVTFTKNTMPVGPSKEGVAAAVFAVLGVLMFAKFAATLVAALVMVLVFKSLTETLSQKAVVHFWKKALIGFIALIVTPVAAVLLAVSVVGLYLAFFIGALYALALVFAGVYMGVLAGALLSKWIRKEMAVDWKWTVLGTVVVFLLMFVPFVGWIADTLLFLAAFGAVTMSLRRDAEEKM